MISCAIGQTNSDGQSDGTQPCVDDLPESTLTSDAAISQTNMSPKHKKK